MPDLLLELARQAVLAGSLPPEADVAAYGGPSDGATCDVCGTAILERAPEIEIVWRATPDADHRTARVHVLCHLAWASVVHRRNFIDGA